MWQQARIHHLATDIAKAKDDAAVAKQWQREVEQLERQVDRLALLARGMWELACERTGVTDADLRRKCDEIDLRDGKQDGRLTAVAATCRACGRKTSARFGHCMTCGAKLVGVGPFDGVGA